MRLALLHIIVHVFHFFKCFFILKFLFFINLKKLLLIYYFL